MVNYIADDATSTNPHEYLFGHLTAYLNRHQTPLRIRKGQHIFNIGDHGKYIYLLASGQVKTLTMSTSGRSCLMEIYTPTELFGTSCLVAPVRMETATAMTHAVMHKISKEAFLSVLDDTNLISNCLGYLADRLTEREQRITQLTTESSERRLAMTLLHLSAKIGTRAGQMTRVDCKLTQQELADMVGTTRSRIGYFLARFRTQGLIGPTSQGRLVVIEDAILDYLGVPPTRVWQCGRATNL